MALHDVYSRRSTLTRGDRAFDACARPHSQHGHVPRRGTVHYNLLHDGSTSTRRHHGQNGMALVDVLSRCSALTRGGRAFDACARPHSQREHVPRRGTSHHNLQLFGTMPAHAPRSGSTCRRRMQNGMALHDVLSRCNALARGDRAFDA